MNPDQMLAMGGVVAAAAVGVTVLVHAHPPPRTDAPAQRGDTNASSLREALMWHLEAAPDVFRVSVAAGPDVRRPGVLRSPGTCPDGRDRWVLLDSVARDDFLSTTTRQIGIAACLDDDLAVTLVPWEDEDQELATRDFDFLEIVWADDRWEYVGGTPVSRWGG